MFTDFVSKSIAYGSSTIQGKLLRVILPIIGILLFIMMLVSYRLTVNTQNKTSKRYITEIAKRSSVEVSSKLDALRIELESIADRPEVKSMVWTDMQDFLARQFVRDSSMYSLLFVVMPDGKYYVAGRGLVEGKNLSERVYVRSIFDEKASFAMTSPDVSKSTGEMKYTLAVPVLKNGDVIGCLAANISLSTLSNIVKEHKIGENGQSFITDENANVIAHNDASLVMNFSFNSKEANELYGGIAPFAYAMTKSFEYSGVTKNTRTGKEFIVCMPIKGTKWTMAATVPFNDLHSGAILLFIAMVVFFVIILSLVFLVVHFGIKNVVDKPLNWLSSAIRQVSDGDLTAQFNYSSRDEIGQMSSDLRNMCAKLLAIVKSIKDDANELTMASNQVNISSQQLSQGANEQASSIEQLSATMEEMVSNIEQNTQNANQTSQVSEEAYNSFIEVSENSGKVLSINKKIAQKIMVINDIASKTNILALNAAVEAARAGDYGRGFAVVATEVRKLAEHSKAAADEIIELSLQGLNMSETVGKVMSVTLPKVENTKSLVGEIAAASAEQTSGTMQINDAIQQLDSVIRVNASASDGLASSADLLAQQAQNLLNAIDAFKV